jgi:hypothetical protein
MPDRSCGPGGRSALAVPQDQAAGLRRLFAPPEPHWLPVLLAPERAASDANCLAALASACVDEGARTLVVDAARAQVAAVFGLRARYDLAHAFSGDCLPSDVYALARPNLRILPAARALEQNGRSAQRLQRFEAGIRALAQGADCVLLVLPAQHARCLVGFGGSGGYADVIVTTGPESRGGHPAIETMRSALSVVDIDTFRLLFQGMDKVCAGRLHSRLALAARELGAQTSDAGSVNDALAIRRLARVVRCRSMPGGKRARGNEGSTALETVS